MLCICPAFVMRPGLRWQLEAGCPVMAWKTRRLLPVCGLNSWRAPGYLLYLLLSQSRQPCIWYRHPKLHYHQPNPCGSTLTHHPARRVGGRTGKKMASLLSMGMRTFETINTKKYDLQLFFGAAALLRLEVRA